MEVIEQITTQSPKVLLAFALVFIGWALKRSAISNKLIPWLLMAAGGGVYPVIVKTIDADYTTSLFTTNIIIGVIIGGASVGLHQLFKQTFPTMFPKNGDTTTFYKKDVEKDQ